MPGPAQSKRRKLGVNRGNLLVKPRHQTTHSHLSHKTQRKPTSRWERIIEFIMEKEEAPQTRW